MLVKLSTENFKSFDAPTEISFISSSKIRTNADHRLKVKRTNILRYCVIYGANAAGKTNLIDLVLFIQNTVRNGLTPDCTTKYCKTRKDNKKRESVFELQFTVGEKFYAYGFSAILDQAVITSEWLYELCQNGSSKRLFEREQQKKPVLDKSVTMSEAERTKVEVYAEDFADKTAGLFLSEMNRGKKYANNSRLLFFKEVYDWINKNMVVITPNTQLNSFEYYYNEKNLQPINELIQTFDTGISDVRIEDISMEELARTLPQHVYDFVLSLMKKRMENKVKNYQLTMRADQKFFIIKVREGEEPLVSTIRLQHNQSFYDFSFDEESEGTRRIFDLMDMLLNKREDMIYIVDELERSLHPKLLEHFLHMFMELHAQQRIQLMFTTHESTIMDQSLFRRDEIWFVERGTDNSSKVYSLDRFKERYDKVLSKAYLEGRYGAIPVFSSFQFKED